MVLQNWKARGKDLNSSQSFLSTSERERILATFAAALGLIALTNNPEAIALDQVYGEFRQLLLEERHQFVRLHVFSAMEVQAGRHFDAVARLLVEVVSKVRVGERRNVTEVLTRIYLEQRKLLEGGSGSVLIDEENYSIWPTTTRPITGIEKAMAAWSMDSQHPAAQQIALEALVAFGESTLERTERQHRSIGVPEPSVPDSGSAQWTFDLGQELFDLPLMGSAALSLATIGRTPMRETVSALFAEWLAIERGETKVPIGSQDGEVGRFGLVTPGSRHDYLRWRLQSNLHEGMEDATQVLKRAYELYRLRWVPFLLVGGFAIWLLSQ